MIRILLTYIVPLLLPAVLYFLWLRLAPANEPRTVPWSWLVAAGVLLVAIVLAGLALLGGTPDGVYEPAHMENGKLIPGHFNPNP